MGVGQQPFVAHAYFLPNTDPGAAGKGLCTHNQSPSSADIKLMKREIVLGWRLNQQEALFEESLALP